MDLRDPCEVDELQCHACFLTQMMKWGWHYQLKPCHTDDADEIMQKLELVQICETQTKQNTVHVMI